MILGLHGNTGHCIEAIDFAAKMFITIIVHVTLTFMIYDARINH